MKSECRHIIINPQGEHGGKETLGLEGYRAGVRKWTLHTSCKVLHSVLHPKAHRNGSKKKRKAHSPVLHQGLSLTFVFHCHSSSFCPVDIYITSCHARLCIP